MKREESSVLLHPLEQDVCRQWPPDGSAKLGLRVRTRTSWRSDANLGSRRPEMTGCWRPLTRAHTRSEISRRECHVSVSVRRYTAGLFFAEDFVADVSSHAPGSFSWAELATTDQASGVAFYAALFDWAVDESPAGPGETYSMSSCAGVPWPRLTRCGRRSGRPARPRTGICTSPYQARTTAQNARRPWAGRSSRRRSM